MPRSSRFRLAALTGNMDMTHGTLADKILRFAIPLAITNVLQQLFTAADMAVVGRFVGESALAAVGSNNYVVGLMIMFFAGISMGANVVLAQCIGGGDHAGSRKVVHTALLLSVTGGFLMILVGEWAVMPILHLLSVPEDVIGMSEIYLRIYLLGLPIIFLYNYEAAVFRAVGDTGTPLILMVLSGIINVFLNLFFVCILHMTVEGVAIATVASNLFSGAVLLVLLIRRDDELQIRLRYMKPDLWAVRKILEIGLPSGIQGSMFSISNITMQAAINSLGTTVIAASSSSDIIEILVYFVLGSFGAACTTFVGQNFGARKMDRCRKSYYLSILLAFVFTGSICLLVLTFGPQIFGFFNRNPEIVPIGMSRLKLVFLSYIFSIFAECASGYLRGMGISMYPAVSALISICGVRVLWTLLVFPHYHTFRSVVIVYPISLTINALLLMIRKIYQDRRMSHIKATQ